MGYTKSQQDGGAKNRDDELARRDKNAAAIRRQKAAKRKANAKSGNGGVAVDVITAARNDRREVARRRRAAEERQRRETEHFHLLQAITALELDSVTNLKEGTTARVVAEATIRAFPDAQAYRKVINDGEDKRVSKTHAAFETALASLTDEHRERKGAVKKGYSMAAEALSRAYEIVKNDMPAAV